MNLQFQPVPLDDETDPHGMLVLNDGRLAAVLTQLSDLHGERSGHWYLECGFGALSFDEMEFDDIESVRNWLESRIALS